MPAITKTTTTIIENFLSLF